MEEKIRLKINEHWMWDNFKKPNIHGVLKEEVQKKYSKKYIFSPIEKLQIQKSRKLYEESKTKKHWENYTRVHHKLCKSSNKEQPDKKRFITYRETNTSASFLLELLI